MRSAVSLLAPMLTPTMPPGSRSPQARERGGMAAVVEAEAVDHGVVARPAGRRAAADCQAAATASRCRSRRNRSPGPAPRPARARPCRSRRRCRPDWGNRARIRLWPRRGSSACGGADRCLLPATSASARGPFRDRGGRGRSGQAETDQAALSHVLSDLMAALGGPASAASPSGRRRQGELAVEMRKEFAAARGLPFQPVGNPQRIDGDEE